VAISISLPFQWYALFCYWQNSSKSIALSVWNATKSNPAAYEEAVGWTGLVNGWYNIVTFLTAFALVGFAKIWSKVRACLLSSFATGFLVFPHTG
jgi:maltose/moltooligosaccharide transporter